MCAAVAPTEFDLHINLNLGKGQAKLYAADLTEEYVEFNKGDISDPKSLEADMQELISKAATLLEALPYIQRFADVRSQVRRQFHGPGRGRAHGRGAGRGFWRRSDQSGGGARRRQTISRALEAAGVETRFVNGLRHTDADSVAVVDQVLSQEINAEIVKMINSPAAWPRALPARTFSPANGTRRRDRITASLGGDCREHRAIGGMHHPGHHTGDFTARDADGQIYNCNADVAAPPPGRRQAAGVYERCARLLRDPADATSLISHLDVAEVDKLKQAGIIASGMIPKVDSATTAIDAGVDKVSFVDGRIHHAVLLEIFTDEGVGTEIVK